MAPTRRTGGASGAAPKDPPVAFDWSLFLKQCRRARTTGVAACGEVQRRFGLDVKVGYFAAGGRPAIETLWAMARVLDCRMEDLLRPRDDGRPKRRGRAA